MISISINILNCDLDKDISDLVDIICASLLYATSNTLTQIAAISKNLTKYFLIISLKKSWLET